MKKLIVNMPIHGSSCKFQYVQVCIVWDSDSPEKCIISFHIKDVYGSGGQQCLVLPNGVGFSATVSNIFVWWQRL